MHHMASKSVCMFYLVSFNSEYEVALYSNFQISFDTIVAYEILIISVLNHYKVTAVGKKRFYW